MTETCEEDDYMSDAILKQCEDKRPGLVFSSKVAKQFEREKKQKVANAKSKMKSKIQVEEEKRTEGLRTAISSENKGFALLQKMGYKPGMVIGKKGTGRAEPVPIEIKSSRSGLGTEAEAKRKQEEMQAMRATMAIKRQRVEANQKHTFLQCMNEKFTCRNVKKDLKTSQAACYQLDTESGYDEPVESFHWPSNYHLLKKQVADDEDVEEDNIEDEEEDVGQDLPDEEKLKALTEYLRVTYFYCNWCGSKYKDQEDLNINCPGDTADAHE